MVPVYEGDEAQYEGKLQPGMAARVGLAVKTNEMRYMTHFNRSARCLAVAARVYARTTVARARRQVLLTNGAALIARMLKVALERRIPIWTEAPVEELDCTDVEAARRLRCDQHLRVTRDLACSDDFLLVTA